MRLFKPMTIRSSQVIDKHIDVVNADTEFPHKYFVYVDFKKPFKANQQVEAFEWALGESGVYSNFLKVVAVKFNTHIKALLVCDFKKGSDGQYRIHLHGVLRCEERVPCRRVKPMWRFRQYGIAAWKLYDPSKNGVAYSMNGHRTVYWGYPACPRKKGMCKGKKGCIHKRRTGNDLLVSPSKGNRDVSLW